MRLFRRRAWAPESYYEPRRHDLNTGFAVVAGVIGAFYAGATQWSLLGDPEYSFALSFAKYEGAVALGALIFAAAGGATGHAIGAVWERWHRRRRAVRDVRNASDAGTRAPKPTSDADVRVVTTSAPYDKIPNFGQLYDAIPAYGARTDVAFYVDVAKRTGGPVLELGCGTGRVLLPIARQGIPIVGVDGSHLMLDRCRKKVAAEPRGVRDRVSLHFALRGD